MKIAYIKSTYSRYPLVHYDDTNALQLEHCFATVVDILPKKCHWARDIVLHGDLMTAQ